MEEFPLLSERRHPAHLSMTTLDVLQRSGALSQKVFGQKVHAHGDTRTL
jgi:hypothetical protein